MKDRVKKDIGTKEPFQDWSTINWKAVKKRIRNLRQRIYRATQSQQWNRVRSLMKLMLRSYSNLLLSVRRVTQENQGRKTAGIDKQTALTPKARVRLLRDMETYQLWKAKPTRRVYIPKSNGKRSSKLYQVAENQNWKCPVCGEHLFNGEELHVHHLTKVSDGGTDEQTNLLHLHKTCHYHVHSGKQTET
ncbi:reverse transcriptase N-terminal domain-containing protein [Nostoc sp. TCL26-01]|uniref:reverse transcriptase N-terminal domain-containing protein n=1 Tax=Nostoc sp. TCL26-01 TaxID=2576904 RepID=UPI0015BFAC77|nr:reverse transcriptase N-terminal domain-containing protein [Nostoc sp. TCL26-01]